MKNFETTFDNNNKIQEKQKELYEFILKYGGEKLQS